jgi:integrase
VSRPRTFHADPRHPLTGKQFRIRARTERELHAYLAHLDRIREGLKLGTMTEQEAARILERVSGRRKRGKTLEEAAQAYMQRPHLSPNTRRRVASTLSIHMRELSPLSLEELKAPRVAAWTAARGRHVSVSTLRVLWWTLRSIVRYAIERGWIDRSPWSIWRPDIRGKGSDRLPREAARHAGELRALLAAAGELDALPQVDGVFACSRVKIATAALLGLRAGELAGLRWSDVDVRAQVVAIVRQGEGRATKARRVDVVSAVPELFAVLEDWRVLLEQIELFAPEGPIFPCWWRSQEGKPLPYLERAEVLTRAELRAAVVRAGLPHPERWTPHSLRDTFVTLEAAGAGGDLAAVRERSRHASIGSLVRYLRAATREPAPPRMLLEAPAPPKSAPRLLRR